MPNLRLADLLASGQFVTLPLGATEERLVGPLDLDARAVAVLPHPH